MKKKLRIEKSKFVYSIIFASLIIAIGSICAFLYPKTTDERLRCIVMLVSFCFLFVFSEIRSNILDDYLFDNAEHRHRFCITFVLLFCISCFFPLFTSSAWPFLFFALVLMLFSNALIGFISYTTILSYVCILGQVDMHTYIFHFFCGVCVIVLFSLLDEKFKIEFPLILCALMYSVSAAANLLITQNFNLSFEVLIIPAICLVANIILMFIFLWNMNVKIISVRHTRFAELNDPETELMHKIKESSEELYYEAIHTAYLCNKISARLSLETSIVRMAGFYHSAGISVGEDNSENLEKVCEEYSFPQEVTLVLLDYKSGKKVKSKEAAIVLMSALTIKAIMTLLRQNPNIKIKYEDIISELFKRKLDSGFFSECSISYYEMQMMRKILIEENLYYDFLRRN